MNEKGMHMCDHVALHECKRHAHAWRQDHAWMVTCVLESGSIHDTWMDKPKNMICVHALHAGLMCYGRPSKESRGILPTWPLTKLQHMHAPENHASLFLYMHVSSYSLQRLESWSSSPASTMSLQTILRDACSIDSHHSWYLRVQLPTFHVTVRCNSLHMASLSPVYSCLHSYMHFGRKC